MELTSKERFDRILKHQPVDRVGLFEVFWKETVQRWSAEGYFARPEMVSDHFGLDVRRTGGEITPGDYHIVNLMADLDAGDRVVEETESVKLIRDGNGALLRWLKSGSGAPEHVDFTVKDRRGWEEHIRPHLLDERTYERRLNFSSYREVRAKCARDQRFMTCGVVGAFDRMSPMCGHEHLLMGMALDPEWVAEMADLYATVTVRLLEILFEREGLPDGLWVWDDLGFKHRPFMSPAMYRAADLSGAQEALRLRPQPRVACGSPLRRLRGSTHPFSHRGRHQLPAAHRGQSGYGSGQTEATVR